MTEVLEPGDPRESHPQFDAAKGLELESLRRRRVFEIVLRDEVPDGADNLGEISTVYQRKGL